MRVVRCAFVAFLVAAYLTLPLVGCGFLDSHLAKNPDTGKSTIETGAEAAKPFIPAPWGDIAIGGATLLTAIYGAFRAHRADVQTDKNNNGIPDDEETPPVNPS